MEFSDRLKKKHKFLNKFKNLGDKILDIFYLAGILSIFYTQYNNYLLEDKEKQYQHTMQRDQQELQKCRTVLKEKSTYLTNNSLILIGKGKDNYITVSSTDYINYKNKLHLKMQFKDYNYSLSEDVIHSDLELFGKILKNLGVPTSSKELDAQLILNFVHTYNYIPNNYTKRPLETLVDNSGDCDDFSVLAYSLMKHSNIDAILAVYSPINDPHVEPYHMMVGVSGNFNGEYITYKNKKYYFTETTGTDLKHISNWKIGDFPKILKENYKILGFVQ